MLGCPLVDELNRLNNLMTHLHTGKREPNYVASECQHKMKRKVDKLLADHRASRAQAGLDRCNQTLEHRNASVQCSERGERIPMKIPIPEKHQWVAHPDVKSGHVYYENVRTGKTQWEKPWAVHQDRKSGKKYYENIATGEVQWKKPKEFTRARFLSG